MKKTIRPFTALLSLLAPAAVTAHPGHGDTEGFSIIHYFSEPAHALTSVVALGILLFVLNLYVSRRSRDENG